MPLGHFKKSDADSRFREELDASLRALEDGRVTQARDLVMSALEKMRSASSPAPTHPVLAPLAAALDVADFDAMAALWCSLDAPIDPPAPEPARCVADLQAQRALRAAAEGRHEQALLELTAAFRRASPLGHVIDILPFLERSDLFLRLQAADLQRVVDAWNTHHASIEAESPHIVGHLARLHLQRATLAMRRGQHETAREELMIALRRADALPIALDLEVFVDELVPAIDPPELALICRESLNHIMRHQVWPNHNAQRVVSRIGFLAARQGSRDIAGYAHRVMWHAQVDVRERVVATVRSLDDWCQAHDLPLQVLRAETLDTEACVPRSYSSFGDAPRETVPLPLPRVCAAELSNVTLFDACLITPRASHSGSGSAASRAEDEPTIIDHEPGDGLFNPWSSGLNEHVLPDLFGRKVEVERLRCGTHVERFGILLTGRSAPNYFHWMTEFLPKLFYLESLRELRREPLILHANMPLSHFEVLELLLEGRHPEKIYFHPSLGLNMERMLVMTSPVDIDDSPWLAVEQLFRVHGDALRHVAERVHAALGTTHTKGHRRIFIGRRGLARNLTNEAEIFGFFEDRGFTCVSPGTMSFAEQVRLFREAEVIAAPSGAALTNILFARPGTRVLSLNSDYWRRNRVFSEVGRAVGVELIQVCGPSHESKEMREGRLRKTWWRLEPFSVPLAHIEKALDDL